MGTYIVKQSKAGISNLQTAAFQWQRALLRQWRKVVAGLEPGMILPCEVPSLVRSLLSYDPTTPFLSTLKTEP